MGFAISFKEFSCGVPMLVCKCLKAICLQSMYLEPRALWVFWRDAKSLLQCPLLLQRRWILFDQRRWQRELLAFLNQPGFLAVSWSWNSTSSRYMPASNLQKSLQHRPGNCSVVFWIYPAQAMPSSAAVPLTKRLASVQNLHFLNNQLILFKVLVVFAWISWWAGAEQGTETASMYLQRFVLAQFLWTT